MTQQGYAGNQRLLDINGSGGAFIDVSAVGVVRRLVIEESPIKSDGTENTFQGLIEYKVPNDGTANGFTTVFEAAGATTAVDVGEVTAARIELGNPVAQFGFQGEIIGQPGQPIVGQAAPQPSTVMIKLRSGTATVTTVVIKEYT